MIELHFRVRSGPFLFSNKKDFSLLLGNILDQFETAFYSFLAPILAPIFFPNQDPLVQLILAYSFLGTSLITRPLGAIVFGSIAKTWGPSVGLSFSILGVAFTTFAIAFLPGFSQMGWLAPGALLLLRMLKGIFGAGESTIARLFILEKKEDKQALQASYYYETSTMIGIIMASLIATLVIHSEQSSGQSIALWRYCFGVAGGIGLLAYFLRHTYFAHHVSEAWEEKYELQRLKLWQQRMNILRVFFVCNFSFLTYVIPFVLFNTLMPLISNITLEMMMKLNTSFLILDLFLIPLIGKIIEKYDINGVMLKAATLLILTMIPLFMFLPNSTLLYVTFFRFWIILLGIIFLCPLNLWFNRLFNHNPDRFLIVGIADSLAGGLGYLTPSICLGLLQITGSMIAPASFITMMMIGAVISIKTVPKTPGFKNQ